MKIRLGIVRSLIGFFVAQNLNGRLKNAIFL